jgi:hypothetical protein
MLIVLSLTNFGKSAKTYDTKIVSFDTPMKGLFIFCRGSYSWFKGWFG